MNVFKKCFLTTMLVWIIPLIVQSSTGLHAQQTTQHKGVVSGKVTDQKGEPLVGVSVQVKGTTSGTITDLNGSYEIKVQANGVLIFSYIGMSVIEKAVENQEVLNVVLSDRSIDMSEVVVVGYGTQSVRKVVSSVSKVAVEKMKNASFSNNAQALSGIAPGIILRQYGGGPGNDVPAISIRGGGDPLYVIDGVISSKVDFARLSTSDIGNISILKDAGASAVYGSRAANGVVLVETKKSAGNVVEYSNMFSYASLALKHDPLSSLEYAEFNNKIGSLYGKVAYTPEEIQKFKDGSDPINYANTDWMDLTVGVAPTQKHNLTVSGTENTLNYLFSLSYQDQQSMFKDPKVYRLNTYSLLSKVGKKFGDSGLKFDMTIRSSLQKHDFAPFSSWAIFGHATNNLPYRRAYDEHGRYMAVNGVNNPVYEISGDNGYDRYKGRNFNGIANLVWDVKQVPGLQVGVMANLKYNSLHQKTWKALKPVYNNNGDRIDQPNPELSEKGDFSNDYLVQSYIKYVKKVGNHNINSALYYEESEFASNTMQTYRKNFISDALDQMFAGPMLDMNNNGYANESARRGVIGRLDYDYKDKYLLSHTFRYDGSERFRDGDRFGYFPSLAFGWRVSEERFFKALIPEKIINDLKFKLSYGETGNDNIARFAFLSTFTPIAGRYYAGDQWMVGYRDNGLPAGDITWYKQKSYNAGFESALLNNKLKLSADAFYYRTTGHLQSPTVSYTTPLGTALPMVNKGAERRGGFECNATWNDKVGEFEYSIGFNLTHYESFWELNPGENESTLKNPWIRSTYESNYTGVGYKHDGYYSTHEEILNNPRLKNQQDFLPGDVRFVDLNGDGIVDVNDQTRLGTGGFPDYYFGFNLNAQYKGFYVSAVIQGATDYDMWLGGRYSYNDGGAELLTQRSQITEVWTPEKTDAKFPRINLSGARTQNTSVRSEVFNINMGYIRLKNIELGYNVPQNLLAFAKLKEVRIFLGGSNLLTYAPGTMGMHDPETGDAANYAYPVEKVVSFGMNIKF